MAKPKPKLKLSARRPSAATAAARALASEESRLAVNLPVVTHRGLKAKAAQEGLSIKEYLLELLKRDGIAVPG
jgi:predicted DNA binding CopG/RHH family protein